MAMSLQTHFWLKDETMINCFKTNIVLVDFLMYAIWMSDKDCDLEKLFANIIKTYRAL